MISLLEDSKGMPSCQKSSQRNVKGNLFTRLPLAGFCRNALLGRLSKPVLTTRSLFK